MRSRLRTMRALRLWMSYVVLCGTISGACGPKGAEYFGPAEFTQPPGPVDLVPPVISDLQPFGNVVLNDGFLCFVAIDGPGTVVSGLDINGMRATAASGALLPITRAPAPNTYLIDVSSLLGANVVLLVVPDLAGNRSTSSFNFSRKTTPPTFSATVPSTGSSTDLFSTLTLGYEFSDPFGIGAADLYVRDPQGGLCTANSPLWEQGSGPGTVGQNRYALGTVPGPFNRTIQLNGALNELRPRTTTYCFHFIIADQAVNKYGAARPNVTERFYSTTYTWLPRPPGFGNIVGQVTVNGLAPLPGVTVTTGNMTTTTGPNGQYTFVLLEEGSHLLTLSGLPAGVQCVPISKTGVVVSGQTTVVDFNCTQTNFVITLQVTYVHVGPGLSYACVRITATEIAFKGPVAMPALTGATWSVAWSGPGVVGQPQRNGTLDANSQALDRQQINLFGSYTANVSVTANGVTKTATGSVTVGGTQGTCTPP